jgi:MHS family proline/betaine transporter-like MFS transporter
VYGRRITMLLSILLITVPTVLIGCLPSYHMIGIAAPVLLAILRFLQGEAACGFFRVVVLTCGVDGLSRWK